MARQWAVNASPIIALGKIGRLSLLDALCSRLVIPLAVVEEVTAGSARDGAADWIGGQRERFVQISEIDPLVVAWDLGKGEGEVLTWVKRNSGFEAIIDDRAARNCADALNIPVRGTVGIILPAKSAGLVRQVKPLFEELMQAGMRVDEVVLKTAIELARE